jgi:hypothetical protein
MTMPNIADIWPRAASNPLSEIKDLLEQLANGRPTVDEPLSEDDEPPVDEPSATMSSSAVGHI